MTRRPRCPGVSIDTRTLKPGDLFIAIRGDGSTGTTSWRRRSRPARPARVIGEPMRALPARRWCRAARSIVVPDTTRALQRLARWVRRQSGARVVAITGSAGKTTTKDVTAAFLGLRYRVMRSSGNLNNHIGLPLSLLELRERSRGGGRRAGHEPRRRDRPAGGRSPSPTSGSGRTSPRCTSSSSRRSRRLPTRRRRCSRGRPADTVLVANADDARVMARVPAFPGRVVTFGTAAGADVSASAIEDRGIDGMAARVDTAAGTVRLDVPLLGARQPAERAGRRRRRAGVRRAARRDGRPGADAARRRRTAAT